ncbi:MAG: META domain-containing protein [Chloroflexi bacterium]|nr:META domain-containing protein [Chloroflexota bacterium]
MSRTTRALLSLALALPMSLGASAALAQSPTPEQVLDQELALTEMAGTAVAPDAGITITIAADGGLSGFGGCNGYSASGSTIAMKDLTPGANIGTCDTTTQGLQDAYFSLVPFLDTATATDGTLSIVSALAGGTGFTFVAAQ